MNKQEILNTIGKRIEAHENSNGSAITIKFTGTEFDVFITIPFGIYEIFYDAKDKDGKLILHDWHDHYGDEKEADYCESLEYLAGIPAKTEFRLTNNGKTVQVFNKSWEYLFGQASI